MVNKNIDEDKNYEAQCLVVTPYGTIQEGQVVAGSILPNLLVYDLSPNQPFESFFKETTKQPK